MNEWVSELYFVLGVVGPSLDSGTTANSLIKHNREIA